MDEAERQRLAPLAAALARARAGRDGPARVELVAGDLDAPGRAGLLAGTFNPLTLAHVALAEAGVAAGCGRVVLVMAPASLAKETVERAHPLDRLDWAVAWAAGRPWAAVAVSTAPLLVDMAEALGRALPGGGGVALLVGADKAAQLVDPRWYDDHPAAMARLGRAASALVAIRSGHEVPELPLEVAPLPTPGWVPSRSATQARAVAAAGGDLSGLVPGPVAAAVAGTGAYDEDPARYLTRAAALERLVEQARE